MSRDRWPEDPADLAELAARWQEPFGDRSQELVFIGDAGVDEAPLRASLDACLLTASEQAPGPAGWAGFDDPFPRSEAAHATEDAVAG